MSRTTPFLIAMSGGSGSGKSTLADALVEALTAHGVVVFGLGSNLGQDATILDRGYWVLAFAEAP